MITISDKTEILIEALPYITKYEGKTFVIKYGGAAMIDEQLEETFAQDVTLLKKVGVKVVIVHGGGKEVTEIAGKLGIPSRFVDGQRYTDEPMMEIVQMVLAGKTNKDIVARINRHDGEPARPDHPGFGSHGGPSDGRRHAKEGWSHLANGGIRAGAAVGICGIDADLLRVKRSAELGLVGEITRVNTDYLRLLLDNGIIPVIAPVGVDEQGRAHNINADVAAAHIAAALRAEKLVYLSDVEGVKVDGALIHSMDQHEANRLIGQGIITDGMIPKIRSAFRAIEEGVHKVHLIDGRITHSLLLEIFTDAGVGTEMVATSCILNPET